MRTLILYALLLGCVAGSAQSDSDLYEIRQIPNDTERVNQLYKGGFAIRNTDPALSFRYAQAAEEAALKSGSARHLAKSYNLKGILHYKKGDYSRALSYQNKALRLNEQAGFTFGMALNQSNLGNIYSDIGYNDAAEACYLKALKAYNALNNRQQILNSLMNLGVLKCSDKQYRLALRYFQTALAMATEDNDQAMMASCNNNIGAVLTDYNRPDSALLYLDESLKLLDLQDNVVEMADVYDNMGLAYTKKGLPGKALRCLQLCDSISRVYDYTDARLHLYQSYSLFYEAQQDFRSANLWLKKHYSLKDSILQQSREAMASDTPEEDTVVKPESAVEKLPEVTFKNIWLLVILGALTIGIPFFLIRYKR